VEGGQAPVYLWLFVRGRWLHTCTDLALIARQSLSFTALRGGEVAKKLGIDS
jgi:hypothetical protein